MYAIMTALGLSTASGINAFIPLLLIGMTAHFTDYLDLGAPYDILEHPAMLITIGVLLAIEFIGDKIPVVDHIFHSIGIVVAPTAGAVVFLAANSTVSIVDPVFAAICGVLAAGLTHGTRTAVRPVVTGTTGGIGNPIISFLENIAAVMITILAIIAPFIALIAIVLMIVLAVMVFRRVRAMWRARAAAAR